MTQRELPPAEWALAHVLTQWPRVVAPMLRKAYKQACDDQLDRAAIAEIAKWVEGYGRALRAAADPAQTREQGYRFEDA